MPDVAQRKPRYQVLGNEVTVSCYSVKDVMIMQKCGSSKAKEIIRRVNEETKKKGYLPYPQGRASKRIYHELYS